MAAQWVSYLRVSTERQGRSGLGLEAQRAAVTSHIASAGGRLLSEYVEVESGKRDDRPQLVAALDTCRLTGATLLIAKLDRLSRDAAFLLGLQRAGVAFTAADMPHADPFTVGIMALVAQREREMISGRTKAALAAAKARGTTLGGFRGRKVDGRLGAEAQRKAADGFAEAVAPIVAPLRQGGRSLREIAAMLTERGIRTQRGGQWSPASVRAVLLRIDAMAKQHT